ncbi:MULTISPECIES: hypothetical protein [Rhodococcus]|jgi:hypothetical protein|uniref:hypothetical protein n=1 Tax=Rhodococcus sp. T9N TaxID=627445 RepID=UPI0021C2607F|nr:hypothetical protein [Rhodococcus sp. T9N]
MNREDAGTTTFDAVVAEYLDKQPDGSKSWLLLRWDLVQLYGTVKAFRRRSREQPAKRAQHCRKRAKTAASIAFLMGSLLVLIVVLGWRLTAFSRERSVIATAGIAVAVVITVVLVFGYALVLVHAFVDRRNRNLMIFQTGGQHIRGGADRSRACRPSPDSRTGTVADSVRVRHRRAVASRRG